MYTVVAVTDFTAAVADVVFLVDDEWLAPEELQPSDTITAFGVVLTVSVASPQYPNIYVTIITGGPAFVNAYWNPAGLVSGTPLGFNFGTRILYAVPGAACRIPIGIYTGHTSAAIADGMSAITSRSRWHARTCRIPVYIVALRQPIPGIRQQYDMPTKRRRYNAAGSREAASESEGEEEARHINAQQKYDIVQETRQMAAIMQVLAPLQRDLAEISTLHAEVASNVTTPQTNIFTAMQRLYDNFQKYTNEVAANPELIELQVPVSNLYTQLLNLHLLVLQHAPTQTILVFTINHNTFPWDTNEPEWETNTLTSLKSFFLYTKNCNAIRVTIPSKPDTWQTASLATIHTLQTTHANNPVNYLHDVITHLIQATTILLVDTNVAIEINQNLIERLGRIHALSSLYKYYTQCIKYNHDMVYDKHFLSELQDTAVRVSNKLYSIMTRIANSQSSRKVIESLNKELNRFNEQNKQIKPSIDINVPFLITGAETLSMFSSVLKGFFNNHIMLKNCLTVFAPTHDVFLAIQDFQSFVTEKDSLLFKEFTSYITSIKDTFFNIVTYIKSVFHNYGLQMQGHVANKTQQHGISPNTSIESFAKSYEEMKILLPKIRSFVEEMRSFATTTKTYNLNNLIVQKIDDRSILQPLQERINIVNNCLENMETLHAKIESDKIGHLNAMLLKDKRASDAFTYIYFLKDELDPSTGNLLLYLMLPDSTESDPFFKKVLVLSNKKGLTTDDSADITNYNPSLTKLEDKRANNVPVTDLWPTAHDDYDKYIGQLATIIKSSEPPSLLTRKASEQSVGQLNVLSAAKKASELGQSNVPVRGKRGSGIP